MEKMRNECERDGGGVGTVAGGYFYFSSCLEVDCLVSLNDLDSFSCFLYFT